MTTRTRIIIGASVLLVAGLLAVPFLLPLDTYRGPIETAATKALGRSVHIKGPMHLTVYPEIGVSLSDVSIANAAGARDADMASVKNMVIGAKVMPLFSGRLEVTSLVLGEPVIHLETKTDGSANWHFDTQNARPTADQRNQGTALNRIGFSEIRINDGSITYYDAASKKAQLFDKVSLDLSVPAAGIAGVQQPLVLNGSFDHNGETLKINGRLDNFNNMLRAQPATARLSIASKIVNAEFTGTIGTTGNISGALKLGARSVRSFAAWMGSPMQPGNGFGLIALEGQFAGHDGVYGLSHTHLAFDSMNLNGDVSLDTNPDVPVLKGHLSIDRLDINPYLAPGASDDSVKAGKAKKADSGAPLSLGGLKSVNADLTLVVGELVTPDLKLDHALVKASLKSGVLTADMSNISAYGGSGKADFVIDASGPEPKFRQSLDMTGLKIQPFLDQLMGVKDITATGSVRMEFAGHGNRTDEIVKNLSGKGEIRFKDGYISGVDLGEVARVLESIVTAKVLTNAVSDDAKTSFGDMGGTFVVKNGVLHTDDLALTNPTVEIKGHGDVDLAAKRLDIHFEPHAKKGLPGLNLVDVGVPFTVKGPWNKPDYIPDVVGLTKNFARKLGDDVTSPIDVLTKPGLSLKSIFGTGKKTN
jgi:AsmA protein